MYVDIYFSAQPYEVNIISTTLKGKEDIEKFSKGFPTWHSGKESPAIAGDAENVGSITGPGRSGVGKWQPTAVFLPGKFHGQTEPWGHKKSDTTEWMSTHVQSLNTKFSNLPKFTKIAIDEARFKSRWENLLFNH